MAVEPSLYAVETTIGRLESAPVLMVRRRCHGGQCPSAGLMVPRSTPCRTLGRDDLKPQAATALGPMSCGLRESLVALIDLLIRWDAPHAAMSLKEQLIVSSCSNMITL